MDYFLFRSDFHEYFLTTGAVIIYRYVNIWLSVWWGKKPKKINTNIINLRRV